MWPDPWSFGHDGDIGILHDPAERSDAGDGGPKHLDRVATAIAFIRIGEHLADISGARCAEHGVRERVRDGVTVGVADEANVGRNPTTAKDYLGAGSEAVGVVADADTKRGNRERGTGNGLSGIGNRESGIGPATFDSLFPVPGSHQAAAPVADGRME
jgi:hypothetical protein